MKKSLKSSPVKVAVFGSSFNPLHLGHLNLLNQVQKKFNFDLIKVIPAWQSPLSSFKGVSEKQVKLIREVFKKYSFVEVDDQEIKRKGLSYTIDTIHSLQKQNPAFKELFLIIGVDQWVQFDKWKNFEDIIKKVHLVVCSRKGYEWDSSAIPLSLKKHVSSFSGKMITFKRSYKKVFWVDLKDVDVSSSEIRQRKKQGFSISHLVPPFVEEWINRNKLYRSESYNGLDSLVLADFCARTLIEKKAEKIKVFDLKNSYNLPFESTVVVSGLNTHHTKVMATHLQRQVKKNFSVCVQQMEGEENGEWIVLDYGDLVVHIFYHYTREYYNIEDLWRKASFKEYVPEKIPSFASK